MLPIETYREILTRQGFTPRGEAFGVAADEFYIRHPAAPNLTLEARLPRAKILFQEETDCLLFTLLRGHAVITHPWEQSNPIEIRLHLDEINAPILAERLVSAAAVSFTELPAPEIAQEQLLWQD